ncbi:MAG TPA: NAD(P)/FAD-dependent oxidoreductase [Bacteroidales bacterium]|nr:NAD(P)/FAD-dependent oxidoreductase [Bacteroidales bacterium]
MKKWGIVGGGVMGMTLALRLAQKGHKVTLYEAASDMGGLASAWKLDDFVWDKFYHVILMSDFQTRTILEELGLDNKMEWVETKTGFYTDGKLYSMSNTIEFLSFPPLNLIDKFRLGLTIFVASRIKNWQRLERIPVSKWLTRWSGKGTYNKIWLPLLRAKLGDSYTETSAAFIWATIQRMYAARRSGLKKEMFGYVKGGYAAIIEAFVSKLDELGVEVKTGYRATEVLNNGQSPSVRFDNGTEAHFDHIAITLPSTVAASLCKGLTIDETTKLSNIKYLGVICASIVLDKPISPYYVTNITDTWVPFTGVIEMSALVDRKYFNGHSLIYLPKYLTPDDPLFRASDEEIRNLFLGSLSKMYPQIKPENVKHVAVARAKNVFALSTIAYSKGLPSIQTTIPGVSIVNSSHITNGTLNVNETIQVAENFIKNLD